jgi:cellulose synthase/poly-beta-1,6-N-acetylglucosamine synthase-like glycosyltransferase
VIALVIVFWTSLLLVVYTYAIYPCALLTLRSRIGMRTTGVPAPCGSLGELPTVDVVIAAHDEEAHVRERVENVFGQEYPADKLRLLLGSDGSSDRTVEVAREAGAGRSLDVHDLPRRGKASVLNDLIGSSRATIVVLSDANTMFEPDALANIVQPFADPAVGAVVGELRLLAGSGDNQDSAYWRVERGLKQVESSFGGLLGANGAIYAIRRELYEPIPPDTIVDDFVIAMRISARGYRLVYAPEAVATEETPPDIEHEFRRRIRIGVGNYQAFFRYPEFLTRTSVGTRFSYVSHKVLRWFTPHLLLAALLASLLLADRPLYRNLCIAQVAGYAFALIAFAARSRIVLPRPVRLPVFLLALNAAFAAGFWRYVTGAQGGAWTRTTR